MKFSVARSGEAPGLQTVLHDEYFYELGSPRCGKLPVRLKVSIVDWHIIRVTLNT